VRRLPVVRRPTIPALNAPDIDVPTPDGLLHPCTCRPPPEAVGRSRGAARWRLRLTARGYGLVTLHRPSNIDDPVQLEALVGALRRIRARGRGSASCPRRFPWTASRRKGRGRGGPGATPASRSTRPWPASRPTPATWGAPASTRRARPSWSGRPPTWRSTTVSVAPCSHGSLSAWQACRSRRSSWRARGPRPPTWRPPASARSCGAAKRSTAASSWPAPTPWSAPATA